MQQPVANDNLFEVFVPCVGEAPSNLVFCVSSATRKIEDDVSEGVTWFVPRAVAAMFGVPLAENQELWWHSATKASRCRLALVSSSTAVSSNSPCGS